MDKEVKISELLNFFPKQKLALEATKSYKFVLYGGSLGAGKSRFLRWVCIYWLLYWAVKYKKHGIRVGLFCEDYPALNDRHISKIKYEFPQWLGEFNEQKHEFTLAQRFGNGVVAFRNLDDASKYVSSEFALIAVDEVTRNNYQTFLELRKRLRWEGISDVKFVCASNPVGEAWVKQYWIDRLFPPEEREAEQFFYVKALPTDNPYLPESYFDNLQSLPERERKAFLEGDWNAFESERDEMGWIKLITNTELNNAFLEDSNHTGFRFLGVDPAAGGDKSAIVLRSEVMGEILFNQKTNDTMSLIPEIVRINEKYKPDGMVVDLGGLGKPIFDRLIEKRIGNVVGINLAQNPSNKAKFADIKAEIFLGAREWILGGGKLKRDMGWNELTIIKYRIDSDMRYSLQSKQVLLKAGIASPNVADAFAYTFSPEVAIIKAQQEYKRAFDDFDYREQPEYGFV